MLRSLLLSRDESTVRMVGRVFKELNVQLENCPDFDSALSSAASQRFDAIVVDDFIQESPALLAKALELPSCNKAVRIVLAESAAPMDVFLRTRTQVIIYKPLSADRVRHGLRAVRNLMARERRQGSKRVPTKLQARVGYGKVAVRRILIVDMSESGAAVRCETGELPSFCNLNLEFSLPGDSENIHATAELVWRDNSGSAGLRFLDMASSARKRLAQWLREQSPEKTSRAAALAARSGR
jgi:hypothetical protein